MNEWLVAAGVLLVGLLGPLWATVRASIMSALVGLELAGVVTTVVLMLLAEGFHRAPFFDLAVVLAFMTFVGALAYIRTLEHGL